MGKKYSQLPAADAVDGSDLVAVVQGGGNKRATVAQLATRVLTGQPGLYAGTLEPNGNQAAAPNSKYVQHNGTEILREWFKLSGTGNTGWI